MDRLYGYDAYAVMLLATRRRAFAASAARWRDDRTAAGLLPWRTPMPSDLVAKPAHRAGMRWRSLDVAPYSASLAHGRACRLQA